jgi:hypothetical protein
MPMRIEGAESKSLRIVQKFTPSSVVRHPAHLQGTFWGELQGTLHGYRGGATGRENRDPFTATADGKELREAGVHPGAKLRPSLDPLRTDFALHPLSNDRLE